MPCMRLSHGKAWMTLLSGNSLARPAARHRRPFIDTDQGDLLLFLFPGIRHGGWIHRWTHLWGLFPPKVTVGTSDASQCRASSS